MSAKGRNVPFRAGLRPNGAQSGVNWLYEPFDCAIMPRMKRETITDKAFASMLEALEQIAHYDDDSNRMDDSGCADGHICAEIARKALGVKQCNAE